MTDELTPVSTTKELVRGVLTWSQYEGLDARTKDAISSTCRSLASSLGRSLVVREIDKVADLLTCHEGDIAVKKAVMEMTSVDAAHAAFTSIREMVPAYRVELDDAREVLALAQIVQMLDMSCADSEVQQIDALALDDDILETLDRVLRWLNWQLPHPVGQEPVEILEAELGQQDAGRHRVGAGNRRGRPVDALPCTPLLELLQTLSDEEIQSLRNDVRDGATYHWSCDESQEETDSV